MLLKSASVASAARRLLLLNRPAAPPKTWARFASSGSATVAVASQQRGKYGWAAAAAIVGIAGSGVYLSRGENKDGKKVDAASVPSPSQSVRTVSDPASEDAIPVVSPVPVADLQTVNARIREDIHSFVFEGAEGTRGRVDVARVSSNCPVEDDWDLAVAKGVDGSKTLYSGVYDGHAGWATSKVLKDALIPYVSVALSQLTPSSSDELIDAAVQRAFVRLDDRILANAKEAVDASPHTGSPEAIAALAPALAGSCALLAIYDPGTATLRTAVTGDSRAVRGAWSPAEEAGSGPGSFKTDVLSLDQTGFNAAEVARLAAEHPGEQEKILDPRSGRLMGLAVTRAFGDHRWKWPAKFISSIEEDFYGYGPRPHTETPPYLTARPELTTRKVRADDFVILASDGLWDMMTNEDAVECVSRWLAAKREAVNNKKQQQQSVAAAVAETRWEGAMEKRAAPQHFAIEDLDSAAVCLVKNALGGSCRPVLLGAMTTSPPLSRYARDDMTVQVIFFRDPYRDEGRGK